MSPVTIWFFRQPHQFLTEEIDRIFNGKYQIAF